MAGCGKRVKKQSKVLQDQYSTTSYGVGSLKKLVSFEQECRDSTNERMMRTSTDAFATARQNSHRVPPLLFSSNSQPNGILSKPDSEVINH